MNTFDPHMHIKEVILVGLGGTGAQIARCIARLLHDTGRAVFPLELLRGVAQVHQQRGSIRRPPGAQRIAHPYPLTGLLFCAQCERRAEEQSNPMLRSRISGVDQNGRLRYRHAEGVKCGCRTRSVFTHVIEDDFRWLISLLTIQEDKLPLIVEMAIQAEAGGISPLENDFEQQKQAAIARLRRKVEAARFLYEDGDLTREEYVNRKTALERDIRTWETRTTDTQKVAVELRMCMEMLHMMASLWDESSDEDRQQLARMIFEEIIYDLDRQRIVHFTLKPWAERFLDLRIALRLMEEGSRNVPDDDDDGPGGVGGVPTGGGDDGDSGGQRGKVRGGDSENKQNRSGLKTTSDLCPIGVYRTRPYLPNCVMPRVA